MTDHKDLIPVAVTEAEYRKASAVFDAAADEGLACLPAPAREDELAPFIRERGFRYVVLGPDRYVGPLYEALPPGGVLARFGVGYDGIDLSQVRERGLVCSNTPGTLEDSVAELAIALILAVARRVSAFDAGVRAGRWEPRLGLELRGRTLAVIGCGAIGRRVGRCAALGFGMRVVGCDPAPADSAALLGEHAFSRLSADFADAVAEADIVSLHLPVVEGTRNFVSADRLARLKAGAILVNTARGSVLDENALYDALAAGRLGGAALDVFQAEPYVPQNPGKDLRTLPNVLMTPHVGSATTAACERMARSALRNIRLAVAGRVAEMNRVDGSGPSVPPSLAAVKGPVAGPEERRS